MEAYLVWLFAALFVVLGLLVRKNPKLIAGYNTMSPERQKKVDVDVEGLRTFMCRVFCMIGVLLVLCHYLLVLAGMSGQIALLLSVVLVPMLGAFYILIAAQRYDRGR